MSNWTKSRLDEVCTLKIGGTPPRSRPEFWDEDKAGSNLWVSIADMRQPYITATAEQITDIGVRLSNVKKVAAGTILMSFKLTVGRLAIAGRDLYTNEAIVALDSPKIDRDFLFYGLQFWDLLAGAEVAVKGATLNKRKLREIAVIYPDSRDEQERIAKVLLKVDGAITRAASLLSKHERIKTGLLQDLLSRGIGSKGQLRDSPSRSLQLFSGWDVLPLDTVATVTSGITLGRKLTGPTTVLMPYLRVFNVQDGYLDLSEVKEVTVYRSEVERFKLQKGDVLLNEGGDYDKLGRGTVWQGQIEPCLHQNHVFRVRANRARLMPEFLELICASAYGRQFFLLNSKQSTNLASINSSQLKAFPVPCPKLEEQKAIVDAMSRHQVQCGVLQDDLSKLRRLKSGLMADLFGARVRVESRFKMDSSC